MLLESLFVLIFNILVVRALGQALWGLIQRGTKPSLNNKLLVAIFVIIVSMMEIKVYMSMQEPNYLQIYKIPRQYTPQELKSSYRQIVLNYHPDKNPDVSSERFQFLRQINDILLKEDEYKIYDRYNFDISSTKDVMREVLMSHLWNQYFMSFVLFYMIATLMTLIQTYHRDLRQARTSSVICLGVSAYLEQVYMTEMLPSWADNIFQDFMVFQIIFIQRIILTMLLVGIVFNQRCLVKGLEWVNQTLNFCKNHFNEPDVSLGYLREVVQQLEKIEEQQTQLLHSSASKIQRSLNILVMLLMIIFTGYSYYQQLTTTKKQQQ